MQSNTNTILSPIKLDLKITTLFRNDVIFLFQHILGYSYNYNSLSQLYYLFISPYIELFL